MQQQQYTPAAIHVDTGKRVVRSEGCVLCSKRFGGKRKPHACNQCFKQFCKKHSRSKLPLRGDPTPVRVCDSCFDDLYFAMDEEAQRSLQQKQSQQAKGLKQARQEAIKQELKDTAREKSTRRHKAPVRVRDSTCFDDNDSQQGLQQLRAEVAMQPIQELKESARLLQTENTSRDDSAVASSNPPPPPSADGATHGPGNVGAEAFADPPPPPPSSSHPSAPPATAAGRRANSSVPPPPPPPLARGIKTVTSSTPIATGAPKLQCSGCKAALGPSDRFCHTCGQPTTASSSSLSSSISPSSSSSSSAAVSTRPDNQPDPPPPPPPSTFQRKQTVCAPPPAPPPDLRRKETTASRAPASECKSTAHPQTSNATSSKRSNSKRKEEPVGVDEIEVTVTLALLDNMFMKHKKQKANRAKVELMKEANMLHNQHRGSESVDTHRLLDTTDEFVFTEEVREVRKRCRVPTSLSTSEVLKYLVDRFYGMRPYYESCNIQTDGAVHEKGSLWFEGRLSKQADSVTFPLKKKNWQSVCRACVQRGLTCLLVRIHWRPEEGTWGAIQTPALDVDAEITRRKDADAEALAATQLAAAQKEAAEAKAQGRTVRPAVAASVGALFEGDVRPSRAVSMQVEQKRQRAKQEKDARAQSAAFMIEGYVHKRSLGLIRLWQKRYMMLDAHSMLIKYFRSEKDRYRAPIGTVPVHYIRRAEPATSGRLGGKFKIVTDTRTFELRAVDNATALNWIEQIRSCIQVCALERRANFNPASALAGNISDAMKHHKNLSIGPLLEGQDGETDPELCGAMRRRQPDGLRMWRERFFVLNESKKRLEWFPKAHMRFKDPKEANVIDVRHVVDVVVPVLELSDAKEEGNLKPEELGGRFDVWVEGHKRYQLLASDSQARDRWVAALLSVSVHERQHPMKNPAGAAAQLEQDESRKDLESMLLRFVQGQQELAKGRISAKGVLWKRSNDFGIERWVQRFWLVLPSSRRIVYFASEADYAGGAGSALGMILRENISKVTVENGASGAAAADKAHSIEKNLTGHFQIHTKEGRVFYLDARSEMKAAKWVHAIRKCIGAKLIRDDTASRTEPDTKAQDGFRGAEEEAPTHAHTVSVVVGGDHDTASWAFVQSSSEESESVDEEEEEDELAEELDGQYNATNILTREHKMAQQSQGAKENGEEDAAAEAERNGVHRDNVDLATCLVIDNGCYSIKAGLASAAQPSLVERTIFARRKDDKSQHTDPSFDLAGVEFGSALHPLHKAWALLVEQEQEGKLGAVTMNVLDRDTRNYLDLQLMWKLCVRRMGGQEALELSKRPVLLTYPLGTDVQAFARAAKQTFLEELGCTYMSIKLAPELAVYSYGRFTALVVDVGYGGVQLLPVVNGEGQAAAAVASTFLAGARLDEIVKASLVHEHAWLRDELPAHVLQEVVEDVRRRLSFVAYSKKQYSQLISTKSVARRYQLPNQRHIVLSVEPAHFGEVYFQPELFKPKTKRTIATHTLPEMILQALMASPEASRDELLSNVCLCGAGSKMPGFKQRLVSELGALVEERGGLCQPKVLLEKGQEFSVWSGGAILTSLKSFRESLVSKWEVQ